eukprot:380636-Pelagomonas_calceolata.AAC.9
MAVTPHSLEQSDRLPLPFARSSLHWGSAYNVPIPKDRRTAANPCPSHGHRLRHGHAAIASCSSFAWMLPPATLA